MTGSPSSNTLPVNHAQSRDICIGDLTAEQLELYRRTSSRSVSREVAPTPAQISSFPVGRFVNYKLTSNNSNTTKYCEVYFLKELQGEMHFDSSSLTGVDHLMHFLISEQIIRNAAIQVEGTQSVDNAYHGVMLNKTGSTPPFIIKLYKDRLVFNLENQVQADQLIQLFTTKELSTRTT